MLFNVRQGIPLGAVFRKVTVECEFSRLKLSKLDGGVGIGSTKESKSGTAESHPKW
jgi:hypothetical protein